MAQHTVNADVVLMGGGIAGLYLLQLLQQKGYNCILLETQTLGSGQTLQSQGIIHGGMKYALSGALNSESDAIKEMPDRWRKLLRKDEDIDLSATQINCERFYMWSAGRLASKFATFFASKVVRGRIQKLERTQYPSAFDNNDFHGSLYKLSDFVVDSASLLQNLLRNVENRAVKIKSVTQFKFDACGDRVESITAELDNGDELVLKTGATIFTAGQGNEALCAQAKVQYAPMQLRPLHMTMVKHNMPHNLFAHCVGTSSKPRITVTTHTCNDGKKVWYLGGDLSETGIERNEGQQIDAAQQELKQLFPWLDFSSSQWATFFIDRAEPKQSSLNKPDRAYTHIEKNIIVSWPTKLTLAPDLGDQILQALEHLHVNPNGNTPLITALPQADIGSPAWENLF